MITALETNLPAAASIESDGERALTPPALLAIVSALALISVYGRMHKMHKTLGEMCMCI